MHNRWLSDSRVNFGGDNCRGVSALSSLYAVESPRPLRMHRLCRCEGLGHHGCFAVAESTTERGLVPIRRFRLRGNCASPSPLTPSRPVARIAFLLCQLIIAYPAMRGPSSDSATANRVVNNCSTADHRPGDKTGVTPGVLLLRSS